MKNVVNYWLFLHLLGVSKCLKFLKCLKCLKFRVMNNKEFSKTEHDDQTLVTLNFSSLSTLVLITLVHFQL